MSLSCRDNIRLLLALIASANIRIANDFTSQFRNLAQDKTPIPPGLIYNPNVTDYRTSWNNHVQELINTLARATECLTIIGAQKSAGKCGCCKWFDDKRLRWREQEVERQKKQVPDTINERSWLDEVLSNYAHSFAAPYIQGELQPSPIALGAGALLAIPGTQPEGGAILVNGCLSGL